MQHPCVLPHFCTNAPGNSTQAPTCATFVRHANVGKPDRTATGSNPVGLLVLCNSGRVYLAYTDRVNLPYRPGSLSSSMFRTYRAKPVGLQSVQNRPSLACCTDRFASASRPNFDRFYKHTGALAAPFPFDTNFYVGVVTFCFTSNSGTGSFFPWFHAYSMLSRPGLSMLFLVPTGLFFTAFPMFFNTV